MRCYGYNSKTGVHVSPSAAQATTLRQALDIFERLKFDERTFFGLIKEDGATLQFAGENDGRVLLVDIPVASEQGSFQLRTVQEAGEEMIREFFEDKDLVRDHKFEFTKW